MTAKYYLRTTTTSRYLLLLREIQPFKGSHKYSGFSQHHHCTSTHTRYIFQVYIQEVTSFQLYVYIPPPEWLKRFSNTVLKIMKPLYEIGQCGSQYYLTYVDHDVNNLNVQLS